MVDTSFDINQHLNQMRFGQQGGGGGSAAAEGMTLEDTLKQGVDKAVQTSVKSVFSLFGIHINADIEGKGALSGFDPQSAMSGGQLANLAVLRPESGGGWLSMLWDMIKKHFTREVTPLGDAAAGGGDAFAGGGGGGDSGGFADGGGGNSAAMAGGSDFSGPAAPGAPDMPDVQVSYGGKMVSADAMVAQLGNLRPDATPATSGADRGADMSV